MSRLVPDLGREKSSRLSTMRRQRCTSLSMILRYSSCAWRSLGVSSSARSASASQQARMVASGLLISCMTPAASCPTAARDRKSTRLNSSHGYISYAVFCLKKKTHDHPPLRRPPYPREAVRVGGSEIEIYRGDARPRQDVPGKHVEYNSHPDRSEQSVLRT